MTKRITYVAQLEFFIVNSTTIHFIFFEDKYVRFNNGSASVNIDENK
jgi:hypothetical protein